MPNEDQHIKVLETSAESNPTHSGAGLNSCPSFGTSSARMDHFALDGLPPTSAVETIPCAMIFVSTAVANHEAALVLRIKPGGEQLGARLNFILWRMDQGELVLASAGGQSWRFQEEDTDLNLETRARRRRQVIGLALRP